MYLDHYCLPNGYNISLQNIICWRSFSAATGKKKVEVFIWVCLLFKNKVPLFYLINYQQNHPKIPDKVGKEVQDWFESLEEFQQEPSSSIHCGEPLS